MTQPVSFSTPRIRLQRIPPHSVVLRPGTQLDEELMHTLYDVRQNGHLLIPSGTRVSGVWHCQEEGDLISTYLTVDTVHLESGPLTISAVSPVCHQTETYSPSELECDAFYQKSMRGHDGVRRRIIYHGLDQRLLRSQEKAPLWSRPRPSLCGWDSGVGEEEVRMGTYGTEEVVVQCDSPLTSPATPPRFCGDHCSTLPPLPYVESDDEDPPFFSPPPRPSCRPCKDPRISYYSDGPVVGRPAISHRR